ncbi:MAG TPA: hypothetical protein VHX13_01200, partial [Acidobacteriaceae bacterium]|nr:hypothetical protein [Acidobacteriaceae bacterium]
FIAKAFQMISDFEETPYLASLETDSATLEGGAIRGKRDLAMGQEKEPQLEEQEREHQREREEQRRSGYIPPLHPFDDDD